MALNPHVGVPFYVSYFRIFGHEAVNNAKHEILHFGIAQVEHELRADNPGDKPVEVTFVLGNTTLGVDASGNGSMNVELNMMQLEPGTEFPVYVMPDDDVKGAPLKVMVRFSPDDLSALPVNHAKALEDVRVTFNPNNSGIRLTLPTQEQAKVVIFDSKERMVKAVKYVSPYLIDITGLEPGSYQLYIQYGNATATRPLEIKGKD